jgi:hypothetical protein
VSSRAFCLSVDFLASGALGFSDFLRSLIIFLL